MQVADLARPCTAPTVRTNKMSGLDRDNSAATAAAPTRKVADTGLTLHRTHDTHIKQELTCSRRENQR